MRSPLLSFGVITDCQYADYPDFINHETDRRFRLSLGKLEEAINFFNSQGLEFVVHLGDLIDREISSFDKVLPILDKCKVPLWQVLGNHDFCGPNYEYGQNREAVLAKIGLGQGYYSKDIGNWIFIITDGNEVGTIEWPEGSEKWKEGKELIDKLANEGKVNAVEWNGGIGNKQFNWIKSELERTEKEIKKAIIFSHEAIYPKHRENLLNDEVLLPELIKHRSLKAFLNGHNHDGNYGEIAGLHCLTFKGMVDTAENSFALVNIYNDSIEIKGFGRELSRNLPIR